MSAFENVDFPEPAGPATKIAYLISSEIKVSGVKRCLRCRTLCVLAFRS